MTVEGSRLCGPAGVLAIPALIAPSIAVAMAVLEYRLYDIDLLINRTPVYETMSAAEVRPRSGILTGNRGVSQVPFVHRAPHLRQSRLTSLPESLMRRGLISAPQYLQARESWE